MTSDDPLDEPEHGEDKQTDSGPSVATRIGSRVRSGGARLGSLLRQGGGVMNRAVTWRRVTAVVGLLVAMAVPAGVLYASWQLAGPLSTIVYTVLFIMAFGLVPATIGLFGSATPGGDGLGKGHFIMANFAAGYPYLLQIKDKYVVVPGTAERFWYDGDWHDVEAGLRNRTVLGWRPFGMLWFKDDSDLKDARTDPAASADGGTHDVERAGIEEKAPPAEVSGLDGTWLIDLKRLYRTGLSQIGNVDLVETAEEQTMRDEVNSGTVNEWSAVIGGVLGLIVGVVTGYAMFMM
jgi:hypothetical protein